MDSIKKNGVVLFCIFFVSLAGCGGTSTTSATDTTSTDGTSTATSSNALAVVYPDDLTVTSITASTSSASSSVSALRRRFVVEREIDIASITEKKEILEDLLNPADATAFEESLVGLGDKIDITAPAPNADCYGPTLDYTNHPEATGGQPAGGQLPSGDLGIWLETESTTQEACVAAKMNNIMGQFESLVNLGTEVVAATLGAASLEATIPELPDAGETLDLTEIANSTMETGDVPVGLDVATITKASEETAEGDPVFTTEMEGTIAGPASESFEFTTALEHIPMGEAGASNETYCGTMTQSVNVDSSESPVSGNCGQANGITRCTYVEYCKESSTSVTYHLRTAEFCGINKACGTVDPTDKFSGSNADGWGSSFYYTICNVNPEDGSGRCAQAWQAGFGDGNTRVLNVEVEAGGDEGCGYFGYGPDVADSTGVGSITEMICNWAGPGNSHVGTLQAQKQCFTRNDDGKFVSDSSSLAIRYAPTTTCNKAATGNFSYQVPNQASTLVTGTTAVTNNLIQLADIDFEMPELPNIPE